MGAHQLQLGALFDSQREVHCHDRVALAGGPREAHVTGRRQSRCILVALVSLYDGFEPSAAKARQFGLTGLPDNHLSDLAGNCFSVPVVAALWLSFLQQWQVNP